MPDLIRHPEGLEKSGCARSLRSFRLPSVARLEFIPMKIGAGMTRFMKKRTLWTDTNCSTRTPFINHKASDIISAYKSK
jgi:hypothetical protein